MAVVPAIWVTIIGLFPIYVSAIFVEKYYTAFWTAFWNIFGMILVFVGLVFEAFEVQNWFFIGIAIVVTFLGAFSLVCLAEEGPSGMMTTFGSSLLMTSLGLAGVMFVTTPEPLIAICVFITNFLFVFAMQERNRARRVTDEAAMAFFLGLIFVIITSVGAVVLFLHGFILVPIGTLFVVVTLWFLLLITLALFGS